jgi:hypothetical protein
MAVVIDDSIFSIKHAHLKLVHFRHAKRRGLVSVSSFLSSNRSFHLSSAINGPIHHFCMFLLLSIHYLQQQKENTKVLYKKKESQLKKKNKY